MFRSCLGRFGFWGLDSFMLVVARISGLVVEYIVAIDVTRARFSADAPMLLHLPVQLLGSWSPNPGHTGSWHVQLMVLDVGHTPG